MCGAAQFEGLRVQGEPGTGAARNCRPTAHTHTSQQTEMAGYPACRVDRFPGVEVAGN
jgi:hypothetical protein